MRRSVWAAIICGVECEVFRAFTAFFGALFIAGCATVQSGGERHTARFEIGLIGDLPYTAEDEKKFPNLVEDINKVNLAFVIHDGDFWWDGAGWNEKVGGLPPCSDAAFQDRLKLAQSFKHPFILTPGDNEWTDCHRAKPNTFDPLERLKKVREMFFARDESLGERRIRLTSQRDDPKYSQFGENVHWTYGDVRFVTMHIVGSNNNYGRTQEMDAEYNQRNEAAIAWLRLAFDLAKRNGNRAIMIIIQANPGFQNNWSEARFRRYMLGSSIKRAEKKGKTGFDDFLAALESETTAYPKPVVLVHGDSHIFRIDQPLVHSKTGRVIENFTRVETFGTPDVHWIRVIIDPDDPNVFTFKPQIVEKNLVNHTRK